MLGHPPLGQQVTRFGFVAGIQIQQQDFLAARAEQRQQPVRGNLRQRFGVVEIVAVLGALVFLAIGHARADHPDLVHPVAQFADQCGVLAPALHQDRAGTFQRRLDVGHALLRIHVGGGDGFRHLRGIGQQAIGQRLQPGLARDLGAGAALGLVRQVQILQPRLAVGGFDVGAQFVGQLALLLDARQHRGAAILQLAQVGQARFQIAQLGVVQPAGDFLAVARDEGDGGAFVEQRDGGLCLRGLGADLGGDGPGDLQGQLRILVLHCFRRKRPGRPGGMPIVATPDRARNGLTGE